jgi:two-component system sensor histidine kinase RpfC
VLFADDEEQIGLVVKRLLERAGHKVECVENGDDAWNRVAANPHFFDFVVIDQQMPGCSGLELVDRLLSIGYAGKIIIQSGRLTPAEESAFRARPVHRILCKPGDVLRLVEIVNGE